MIEKIEERLLDSRHISATIYDVKIVNCGDYSQVYVYDTKKTRNKKSDNIDLELTKETIKKNLKVKEMFIDEDNKNNSHEKVKLSNTIEKRSIIRSKLVCQRIAKANVNHWNTFITLTFAENITDVNSANKRLKYYIDKVKRVKKDFKYLCIPEFQKRGAIHYHLLTNLECDTSLIPKKQIKKLYNPNTKKWKNLEYYDLKYWNDGFSSAEIITGDIKKIVGYVSKYMTKDIDNRLFSKHRYFYSQNLTKVKEDFINLDNYKDKEYYLKKIQDKELIYQNEYINPYDNTKVIFLEFCNK